MKRFFRIFLRVLGGIVLVVILFALFLIKEAFIPLSMQPYNTPEQKAYSNWDSVFNQSKSVTVQPIQTGGGYVDISVWIDETSPNKELVPQGLTYMTVTVFLIHHPEYGEILVDTGLNDSFQDDPDGDANLLTLIVNRMIGWEIELHPGEGLQSQLKKHHIDPQKILITHTHSDHLSGIPYIQENAECIVSRGDINFISRATGGSYLSKNKNIRTLDFSNALPIAPFDNVIDLFGDASVWAISTPGHSADHVAFLVNTHDGPVFLPGDAICFKEQLEHDFILKETGASEEENKQSARSFQQIKTFIEKYPEMEVLMSHEVE